MSFLSLDPGDPNNWYQSPQLGLFPVSPAVYGGGISGPSYPPPPSRFPLQPSYPLPPQFPFQPSYSPPAPHSQTIITGYTFPPHFPYPNQTHMSTNQLIYPHSHAMVKPEFPSFQPQYALNLSIPTFQSPSVPTFVQPQPQFTDPIPPSSICSMGNCEPLAPITGVSMQQEVLRSKPAFSALIDKLEMLCQPPSVIGTEEISLASLGRNPDEECRRDDAIVPKGTTNGVHFSSTPALYPELVSLNTVPSNLNLLSHDNLSQHSSFRAEILEELGQLQFGPKSPVTESASSPLKFGSQPAGSVTLTVANGTSSSSGYGELGSYNHNSVGNIRVDFHEREEKELEDEDGEDDNEDEGENDGAKSYDNGYFEYAQKVFDEMTLRAIPVSTSGFDVFFKASAEISLVTQSLVSQGRTGIRGVARFSTLGEVSSPAAAATKPSWSPLGGLFGWLTGGRSRSMPPLDFPLEGVKFPPALPDYVQPEKPKITTLPNGVKIASVKSEVPTASIGLYVNCGSVYETAESSGISHLLERMAFKSTRNRSHLRIVREMEAIGGNVQASASREQMSYTITSLKTYVPEMVEVLLDSVRNPVFLDWEVNEELLRVKDDINEASKNPEALVLEAVHSVGYKGGLANPLLAQESSISRLDSEILEEFVAENYTAPRMVLAAYGVEHEELLKIAEPLLSDLPNVPLAEEPTSMYTGGDYRCQAESGDTHFALAFELPGGWLRMKDAMILNVLQMLMGGGESFSTGGPGKGMNSRLYIRVLAQNPEVKSMSAINSIYNNSALFGIQASTSSDYVTEAIDIAADELIALATPGEVDLVQLDRAKQSTKSSILMNLESRMIVVDDIGRQILTYNEWKFEQLMKAVDEVSLEDITSTAQKLLSTPLTMASYGDVTKVPRYDSVSQRFSLSK